MQNSCRITIGKKFWKNHFFELRSLAAAAGHKIPRIKVLISPQNRGSHLVAMI
jgi:hypothetical protein